jgi:hypothetical protein
MAISWRVSYWLSQRPLRLFSLLIDVKVLAPFAAGNHFLHELRKVPLELCNLPF